MVLGVGLISVVLLNKKRPGYKTRLQKLQEKLKHKPLKNQVMFEIPTKKIFIILLIIGFIFSMDWISSTFESQIIEMNIKLKSTDISIVQDLNKNNVDFQRIERKSNSSIKQVQLDIKPNQAQPIHSYKPIIFYLKCIYIFGIACICHQTIFKITKFQILNNTEGKIFWIKTTRVSILFPKYQQNAQKLILSNNTEITLKIRKIGQQRFSNYNSHYCLQLTSKNGQNFLIKNILIRADIYSSRKALIQISSILGINPDLKIYDPAKPQKYRRGKNI